MKSKLLLLSAFVLLFVALAFQSCNKSPITPTEQNPMEKLKIPDGFEFKTTSVKSIEVMMPSTIDFSSTEKSRVNIFSDDPAIGGKLLSSGSFNDQGTYSGTFRVPTALDSVYVQTIAGSEKVAINSTTKSDVIVDLGFNYGTTPPDTVPPTSKAAPVSSINTGGVYKPMIAVAPNLISNGNFETNDFGSIPYWNYSHPVDGKWYLTTYYGKKMEWYNDGGNHVLRTPYSDGNYYGGVSQMINASPGNLITFTANVKSIGNKSGLYAWLYIIPMNANNQPIAYYYMQNHAPATAWKTMTVAATMPAGTVKVNILIWTWDLKNNSSIYFDNVYVTGPILDSDGDGVNNELDDYPDDATRAFNVYYPNETDWGTFAFEDLWPGMGDYDFNDLVLDYHFKSVLNASNKLVEFYTDYSVRAVGASLKNGFGFELGGSPANVASVTGTHYTENYIHNNTNGTEQGQRNTVVILFDNAFSMIGSSGSAFINTVESVPYVNPDTNLLHVVYSTPADINSTGTAPYNPFLIVNGDRGKEVHLPGQKPTDLVNTAYFDTQSDDTQAAIGKYYQTATNLPWAIDLPVSFAYPVETVPILSAYNYFDVWAESAGALHPDWYKDLTGNIVSSNVYTPQTK